MEGGSPQAKMGGVGGGGGGEYSDTQLYGFHEERLRVAMVRLDRHHISQTKSPLHSKLL
jgi:hypothetical protein